MTLLQFQTAAILDFAKNSHNFAQD